MPNIYKVIIHPSTDTGGYWAECASLPGGCFTDGDTIQEIMDNMKEAVSLFLQDDYPDIRGYSLQFEVQNA